MKTKRTLILLVKQSTDGTYGGVGKPYKVKEAENSTEFSPGQYLSRAEVDSLIEAGWTIKIRPVL